MLNILGIRFQYQIVNVLLLYAAFFKFLFDFFSETKMSYNVIGWTRKIQFNASIEKKLNTLDFEKNHYLDITPDFSDYLF